MLIRDKFFIARRWTAPCATQLERVRGYIRKGVVACRDEEDAGTRRTR